MFVLIISILKLLISTKLGFIFTCIGAIWIISKIDIGSGKKQSKLVQTSQSRDELMKRNAAAMEKYTNQPITSKRVRNGFYNYNESVIVNGQLKKK